MDPLADKVAFFQRLSAIRDPDEDDDAYGAEEQTHRKRCKKFHDATSPDKTEDQVAFSEAAANSLVTSPQPSKSQGTQAHSDLEIIAVTPCNTNTPRGKASRVHEDGDADESIIPDSTRASNKPVPASLQRLLRSHTRRQSSAVDSSPSTSASKRKGKQTQVKQLPEHQQIFRELQFYYYPDDDINKIRKAQINKAQEHGATWVRTPKDASHFIIDEDLAYKHIEPIVTSDSTASSKVIVNAKYPIDCVIHRTLLDPNQHKYVRNLRAADQPRGTDISAKNVSLPQATDDSLKITRKSRRSLRKAQESSCSSDINKEDPNKNSTAAGGLVTTTSTTSADDELSQYISLVQGNPGLLEILLEEDDEEVEHDEEPKNHVTESGSEGTDDEREKSNRSTCKQRQSNPKNFACMKGGTKYGNASNPNARTIELLQLMADHYEDRQPYRWASYRRAITTLGQQNKRITTAKEALRLPGIGTSLAATIEEVATEDRLRRLEYAQQRPEDMIANIFLKIYGVGIKQADKWVAQGHRTLQDLKEKVKLNESQRIGLEHFDDLNERIPRWEVGALAGVVKEKAAEIDGSVEFIIGGSYRRGSKDSGDIDLIITKKGTTTSQNLLPFLEKLVQRLTAGGFLTASLASFSGNTSKGHGSKWHGCCVLPKAAFPENSGQYRPIWRRIDFLLVPESELGAALIYFTGNDIFNRSIRYLASRKSMRLNQRGLFQNVIRDPGGVMHTEGDLLEGRDEKKIFELLGVKWREPHERWC